MEKITVGDFVFTDLMREYTEEVFRTGRISYGPFSREFEEQFAAMHDSEFGVLSNSGTSSLQVALQAMKEIHGWEDGDEVIVPSVTFVATLNIVLHNRMKPVVVDVDPRTYNMNPDLLSDALTDKTRCIIPVHTFGQPAYMHRIKEFADLHGLKIIEDSCESMGVGHFGKKVGSWGDIGCFSLYVAHIITAGVGGVAITDNVEYAAKMRSLVNHGRDGIYISIDDDQVNGKVRQEVIDRRFRFESIGHSFRITEMESALALAQLVTLEDNIRQRNRNARFLTNELYDFHINDTLRLPHIADGNTHAFMMYPIVTEKTTKWELVNHLERNGIETREMLPLINQPVYKNKYPAKQFPVADRINKSGFYVGCHPSLGEKQMRYIADTIKEFFGYGL
jgi:perosamine synthetase